MYLLVESYLATCNGEFVLEIAAKKAHDQKFGSLFECFFTNLSSIIICKCQIKITGLCTVTFKIK